MGDIIEYMGQKGKITTVLTNVVVVDFSPFSKTIIGKPELQRVVKHKDYQIIIESNKSINTIKK
ncbi:hypothetical protein [Fictibacillus enclensis]|uniref:hypothetical protein n=1 Tax=Fictibacillus enclensis TaxID=1017270 RepID=UPI0033370E3D